MYIYVTVYIVLYPDSLFILLLEDPVDLSLLAYRPDHRGYRCFDLSTHHVITSHYVVLDETSFLFKALPSASPSVKPDLFFLWNGTHLIARLIIAESLDTRPSRDWGTLSQVACKPPGKLQPKEASPWANLLQFREQTLIIQEEKSIAFRCLISVMTPPIDESR